MRCLVTGAYGFIGREVVAALQGEGFTVIGAGRDLDFASRILPACDVPLKSFRETLQASPATVQDRLHARSAFAVPLLQVTLALFWMLTGTLTLMPESFTSATSLVSRAGFDAAFARALVGVASIADIIAGALFLLPRWVRLAGVAQLILSTVYLIGLSVVAPELWTDHFGPLLKVVPMMAATIVVMAFQENR